MRSTPRRRGIGSGVWDILIMRTGTYTMGDMCRTTVQTLTDYESRITQASLSREQHSCTTMQVKFPPVTNSTSKANHFHSDRRRREMAQANRRPPYPIFRNLLPKQYRLRTRLRSIPRPALHDRHALLQRLLPPLARRRDAGSTLHAQDYPPCSPKFCPSRCEAMHRRASWPQVWLLLDVGRVCRPSVRRHGRRG